MSIDSKKNLERLQELLKKRKEGEEEPPKPLLEELGLDSPPPKEKKDKEKEKRRQNAGRKIKPKR